MNFKKTSILIVVFSTILASTIAVDSTIITSVNIAGQEIEIKVTEGEEWDHKLRVIRWLPFIRVTNQPQMAFWIEDSDGEYLKTLYVTQAVAKQDWRKAPSDPTPREEIRRPESLPHWAYQRGVQYEDGLYKPTRDKPLADAITLPTPESSFNLFSEIEADLEEFIIKAEINHSTHFNDFYDKDLEPDSEHYGGGRWGSGQPAIIYAKKINLTDDQQKYRLELIGHSSPGGQTGKVYTDMSKLTTAKEIVEEIVVQIK